jgi:prephenate dehydrogenase
MVVGIAGLGVIGGSIGLALQRRGLAVSVVGCDVDQDIMGEAMKAGCCTSVVGHSRDLGEADVVFVAVPPNAVRTVLERLEEGRGATTVVTDCTSTKAKVVEWAQQRPDRAKWFVPGHPIAGGEGTGPGAADANAFEGAFWVLTSLGEPAPLQVVEGLVTAVGATPIQMTAESHDRHVAVLSHLPHALASALVLAAGGLERPGMTGGSWRDLTRVAGSNPGLWQQILLQNRDAVLAALDSFDSALGDLRAALGRNDGDAVRAFFEEARLAKRRQTERQ